MAASARGSEGCLRLLIAAGVDLEHKDKVRDGMNNHMCVRIWVHET